MAYPPLETEPFLRPLLVANTLLLVFQSRRGLRLISSPFPIPVRDQAFYVQCSHSDTCHFGHFNRSCYLLTYLLTYLLVVVCRCVDASRGRGLAWDSTCRVAENILMYSSVVTTVVQQSTALILLFRRFAVIHRQFSRRTCAFIRSDR